MKDTAFFSSLIRGIEKVYKRISMIVLRKRMSGYNKQPVQSASLNANDLKSPLLDCVDNIIDDHRDNSKTLHDNDRPAPDVTTSLNKPAEKHIDKPHIINGRDAGELAKHYKETAVKSELYPEIARKLQHSIWEHIHATIRYARLGDKRNAEMHTDIANSAFKELAHHVTEEQYQAFVVKIGEYLDSLKSGQKKSVQ